MAPHLSLLAAALLLALFGESVGAATTVCPHYAYVYKTSASGAITTGADVPFDTATVLSGFTHTPGGTTIVAQNSGTYKAVFSVAGSEPNQFSIFKNGIIIVGTLYGSGAGQQQNTGQSIISLQSGDVLTLRNFASATAVTLAQHAGGSAAHVMASLFLEELLGDYAFIFKQNPGATVAQNADVPFDTNGAMTGAVTHVINTPTITIVSAGTYVVTFSVSGSEPNQFALFVNGIPAAGTTYGSGAGTQQNTGRAVLVLGAGNTLTLRNFVSPAAVTLAPFVGGAGPNVMASVLIEGLASVPAYAYTYVLAPTTPVSPGASVAFTSNGALLGATHTAGSTDVVVPFAGVYSVMFMLSGTEINQFAVFVNGVVVPEAIYGSNDNVQQNTGQVLLPLAAGDVLTLRNHISASAVTLAPIIGGTQANTVASLLVKFTCAGGASPTPALTPSPSPAPTPAPTPSTTAKPTPAPITTSKPTPAATTPPPTTPKPTTTAASTTPKPTTTVASTTPKPTTTHSTQSPAPTPRSPTPVPECGQFLGDRTTWLCSPSTCSGNEDGGGSSSDGDYGVDYDYRDADYSSDTPHPQHSPRQCAVLAMPIGGGRDDDDEGGEPNNRISCACTTCAYDAEARRCLGRCQLEHECVTRPNELCECVRTSNTWLVFLIVFLAIIPCCCCCMIWIGGLTRQRRRSERI